MLKHVNRDSAVPVYQQIENVISYAVASGNLEEGDSVPSMRELADQLNLNMNTIAKAVRDLEVMEILHTARGVNSIVKKGAAAKCQKTCRQALIQKMHEVLCEAKAAGMTKQEMTAVVRASLDADTVPYGPVPESIMRLA